MENIERRDFIKMGTAGITFAAGAMGANVFSADTADAAQKNISSERFSAPPIETVRVGYVGVGGMGTNHLKNLLKIEGNRIVAVCDIVPERAANAQKLVVEAGQKKPASYGRNETDFVRMCETEDLDLVYTATPWEWHVPVCVAAMKNGKHAATEVPAAVTVDECWELVESSEKYKKHCVMMENCCYGQQELMVLYMVRKGLFGDILHAEGGYLHDLRTVKFDAVNEGKWRLEHSIKRNGNHYPTHGLGPVSQCMNINRGDRYDYIVSMSTPSKGLNEYAAKEFGATDIRATRKYALGDVNVTLIKTINGKTITVIHDCNLPRAYSRINIVQGTKGLFQGYPELIHVEGESPAHEWGKIEDYKSRFEHPLWKAMQDTSKGAGHGGMDFIEDYRLIKCLREGLPTDMDVYDGAAWSVISGLSEWSVANRSKPIDVPDFTRGRWKTWEPLGIITG